MELEIVAALSVSDRGIGFQGKIPWHLSGDMKHFANLTRGHIVIMGRNTWESLPRKPLPDRINIVLSSRDLHGQGVERVTSFDEALAVCAKFGQRRIFVIGGQQVYQEALSKTTTLHLTLVFGNFPSDVYFPEYETNFSITHSGPLHQDETNFSITHSGPLHQDEKVEYKMLVLTRKVSNPEEQAYLNAIQDILQSGEERNNRTGVKSKALFGLRFEFSLGKKLGRYRDAENQRYHLPLQTSRRLPISMIMKELKWICKGDTKTDLRIWKMNTSSEFIAQQQLDISLEEGDIGASYGFQLRHFGADVTQPITETNKGIDQLQAVVNELKSNPTSRRIIISLWNPSDLKRTPLPPCMLWYQFFASADGLTCQVMSRSSDIALAGGWNIAFASLLTIVIAKLTDQTPHKLIWVTGDTHIYEPNYKVAEELSRRTPTAFPEITITSKLETIDDIQQLEYKLHGYNPVEPNLPIKMIA